MKTKILLVLFATLISVNATSAAVQDASPFLIRVEAMPDGVQMTCMKGCAWETLTFSCRAGEPCGANISFQGMAGG